jgi:hypothetical protein
MGCEAVITAMGPTMHGLFSVVWTRRQLILGSTTCMIDAFFNVFLEVRGKAHRLCFRSDSMSKAGVD